jgi:hypothetical protein
MPKYVKLLEDNFNLKSKGIHSLYELPKIFVNATRAIDMFVSIWLGKKREEKRREETRTIVEQHRVQSFF